MGLFSFLLVWVKNMRIFYSLLALRLSLWGTISNGCPSPLHLTFSWGVQQKVRHTFWKLVHNRIKLKFWLIKKHAPTSVVAGLMWCRLANRAVDDLDLVETGVPRVAESIGGELNGLTTNDGFSSTSRRCRPLMWRQAWLIHEDSLLNIAVMLMYHVNSCH